MKNPKSKQFIILCFLISTLLYAVPLKAASLEEKIPSPAEIKNFRVTKRIGNTLYGIRLVQPKSLGQVSGNSYLKASFDSRAFTAPVDFFVSTSTGTALPWEYEAISPVFDYAFNTNGFYDPIFSLELRIYHQADKSSLKKVFSYDSASKKWQPLKFSENVSESYLALQTNSTMGKIIAMSDSGKMSSGKASWYKYKNGLFAASPDYEKGSVLRVYNVANGKSVDVTINDYGPDRSIHPDRVIDLDYVAFSKIASTRDGIISVRVEPIKVIDTKLKPSAALNAVSPIISASSAVVMLEKDNNFVFSLEADKVMPIASLTKLVFAKVFLDLKPDFNQIVSYKYQDEKYNYEYCEPWESSRLRVKEGETMTVRDLFYSAIVGSANNAVESLVRISGLSRQDFIAKMNAFAKNIGAKSTKFIEPTGLSPENVSSAFDYAIIAKEVLNDKTLQKISATEKYSFQTINTKEEHNLKNTNKLIGNSDYSITGSKTGYLHEAGYCLMTFVDSPDGKLITVNLNSKSRAENFYDNEQLIKYGLKLLTK